MGRRKILTVVGARPAIHQGCTGELCHRCCGSSTRSWSIPGSISTHGMSDVFFEELGIPQPAYVLGIHGGGHGAMTGRMMIALEEVVAAEKPDAVLIYGDTNSTLAVPWLRPSCICRSAMSRRGCARSGRCRRRSTVFLLIA